MPGDEGLGMASPHQAMQVPEGKFRVPRLEPGAPSAQDRMAQAPPLHCPPNHSPASKWGLVAERLLDLATGFSDIVTRRAGPAGARLLELHIFKLVALYTVWVALKEVSMDMLAHPRGPPGAVAGAKEPVGRVLTPHHP